MQFLRFHLMVTFAGASPSPHFYTLFQAILRFHLMVTFAGASFSPQNTHFSKHFPPILRGNLNAISAISPDGHFKIFVRWSGPFPRGSYPDLLRNFWLSLYGLTRKSKSSLAFWIELNIYLQPWANKFLLHLENLLARADAATHFYTLY